MVIIVPTVASDPGRLVPLQAPATEPMQDATGSQHQALGRGMLRAGAAVHEIGRDWQHRINSAAAKQFDSLLADKIRRRVADYQAKVGFDAYRGLQEAQDGLDEDLRSVEGVIENEVQRDLFGPVAAERLQRARFEIDRHGDAESRTYQMGESKARELGARADALRTVGTENHAYHRAQMLEEVDEQAGMFGFAPDSEQRKQLRLAATTELHEGVIRGLVNQDPQKAAAWLQANHGEIEPIQATKLQDVVQRANQQARAAGLDEAGARVADELARATGQTDSTGVEVVDVPAAMKVLRDGFAAGKVSFEVRERAERRLEHLATVQQKQRDRAINQAVADAEAALTARPGMDPHDLPRPTLAVLVEHGKLNQLIAFANNGRYVNRNDALQEVAALTDSGQLASMTDEQFRKQFWGRLDNQTFERVNGRRTSGRAGVMSDDERFDADLIEAGLLPPPGVKASDEQLQRAHRLKSSIDQMARAKNIQDRKGQRELTKQLLADVAYESVGSDELLPLAAMTPEERATAYVRSSAGNLLLSDLQALDPELRGGIEQRLREAGLPVTDVYVRRYVGEVLAPRTRATEQLLGTPQPARQAALDLVRSRGGDPTDPVTVSRAVEELDLRRRLDEIEREKQARRDQGPNR
jgi:hypothetical protein